MNPPLDEMLTGPGGLARAFLRAVEKGRRAQLFRAPDGSPARGGARPPFFPLGSPSKETLAADIIGDRAVVAQLVEQLIRNQ